MSYISDLDIKKILMAGPFTSIPKLVNRIHFDKDHPENHNLAITNKKSKYGSIRKNNKWQMILIKDMLSKIIPALVRRSLNMSSSRTRQSITGWSTKL